MKNEVYAAIAMALYEFKGNNVHDKEDSVEWLCPYNDRTSLKKTDHEERI